MPPQRLPKFHISHLHQITPPCPPSALHPSHPPHRSDSWCKQAEEPTEGLTAIMTKDELEALQRLRPLEIKKKLRSLGVAPEDHPG